MGFQEGQYAGRDIWTGRIMFSLVLGLLATSVYTLATGQHQLTFTLSLIDLLPWGLGLFAVFNASVHTFDEKLGRVATRWVYLYLLAFLPQAGIALTAYLLKY